MSDTGANGRPARPKPPAHPFRQSVFFYGGLAVVGFLFLVFVTGQSVGRAAFGACLAFVLETGWTWWRMYVDQKRAARAERAEGR